MLKLFSKSRRQAWAIRISVTQEEIDKVKRNFLVFGPPEGEWQEFEKKENKQLIWAKMKWHKFV